MKKRKIINWGKVTIDEDKKFRIENFNVILPYTDYQSLLRLILGETIEIVKKELKSIPIFIDIKYGKDAKCREGGVDSPFKTLGYAKERYPDSIDFRYVQIKKITNCTFDLPKQGGWYIGVPKVKIK